MKKILSILLIMSLLLVGCGKRDITNTFMKQSDNELYALYDVKGKQYSDYIFKTFREMNQVGYIVTNDQNQVGFIDQKGEQTINFGDYDTLSSANTLLIGTKKQEQNLNPSLNYTNHTLNVNSSIILKVINAKGDIKFSSEKAEVASVSNDGKVTALKEGTTSINVTVGEKKLTCKITVTKEEVSNTDNPTPTISDTSISLKVGDAKFLTVKNGISVKWSSNNTKVATVVDGKVTAKAVGSATITAQSGDKSLTCIVRVQETASKRVEAKNIPLLNTNAYVINSEGKVIVNASESTGIKVTGLPVIQTNDSYRVMYDEKTTIYDGKEEVYYVAQSQDNSAVLIAFRDHMILSTPNRTDIQSIDVQLSGNYAFYAVNEYCAIVYDDTNSSVIYFDYTNNTASEITMKISEAYFDENQNKILKYDQSLYVINEKGEATVLNSYYKDSTHYIVRNTQNVYGPHVIHSGNDVVEIKNVQLFPGCLYMAGSQFPGYVRNKGFQYYDYNGDVVIEEVFLDAQSFDANGRAIVQLVDKTFALIDESGTKIITGEYSNIKYIASTYYAVYNKDGKFGVYNSDGNEILPIEYTRYPEEALVYYDEHNYLTINKNGRSYVYNIDDDMKVVFSVEGDVILNKKGYFIATNSYYTMSGDKIQ